MVKIESFDVSGWQLSELIRLVGGQRCLERARHLAGNFALNRENVLRRERAIVTLGPEVPVAGGIDQLDIDMDLVARTLDPTFQDGSHSQLPRDLFDAFAAGAILFD